MQTLKLSILRRERDTGIRDFSARRLFNRIAQANNSLIRGGVRPSVKVPTVAEYHRQQRELRAQQRRREARAALAERARAALDRRAARAQRLRLRPPPRDIVPGGSFRDEFGDEVDDTDSDEPPEEQVGAGEELIPYSDESPEEQVGREELMPPE